MLMAYWSGTAERPDRAKAIAGVILVHVALAFVILSGLNVRMVGHAVERLTMVNVREAPPPPPVQPPPKPAPKPQTMKKPTGAPATKAQASPVVAPPPKLPVPSPIPAARIAGIGSATTSGAAAAGTGTGAGGAGNGPGGGGDYSRFTPARKLTKIPDREYRRIAGSGIRRGSVAITVKVNTDGSASNCRIARTSGSGTTDALVCQLTLYYVRFSPARDAQGRPVPQDITWAPDWSPNRW
jgi:periplasmic protein TonB